MFTTLSKVILTTALSQEQNGKMSLMTGNARCAAHLKMILKKKNNVFVKSPTSALRCILRHCGGLKACLVPQNLHALNLKRFFRRLIYAYFYEFISNKKEKT
jgi:hypothetical protein